MREEAKTRGTIRELGLLGACAGLAVLILTGTALPALAPNAATNSKQGQQDLVSPADAVQIEHRRVHYTGDVWMTISNDGSIGTNSGTILPDPIDLQLLRINYGPSFESPAGSRVDYLFNGGLWVGGIVGADTLMSSQITSGSGTALEWNGFTQITPGVFPGYPGECDQVTRHLEQGYTAVFSDTLIKPTTSDIKGRLHLPLGLEVVQTTHQSSDNFTRRFVIHDFKIKNISGRPIEQMWFGFFMDNDCFGPDVSGCNEDRASDDLSGILTTWPNPINPLYTDSLMVAWSMDNDGDACGGSRFRQNAARGAIGVRILRGPTPQSRVNFNWFGFGGGLDWGPRLATDLYSWGTGGTGAPEGDAGSYHMMSNGEVDYSQPYSGLDFRPEWAAPLDPSPAANVANGLDSRIVISAGPLPLLRPDETVPFTVAFIAGAGVHRIASNTIDPLNPQAFMDKLDFRDLATNAWWAGFVWDNFGFDSNPSDANDYKGEFYRPIRGGDTVYYSGDGCPDLAGPSPPPPPDTANSDLRLTSLPGELILSWSGRTVEAALDPLTGKGDFEGYRVYLAERSAVNPPPSSADYALIASWDRPDFRRYTYNERSGLWDLDSDPLSNEQWREVFGDTSFDATKHPSPSLCTECPNGGYRYEDTLIAYFAPHDANHGNEYVVADSLEQNLIQRVAVRDTVIDDIAFQYGEYELHFTGLLQSRHYFLTLTAFDFEGLETSKGSIGGTRVGLPIYSADKVAEYEGLGGAFADSVRVSVYPNPYKISFEDATGHTTSYFDQGLEGEVGQTLEDFKDQDRRIHFINVPDTCVINIYTLDGDLVRTLEHPDDILSGYSSKISWDLVSRNTQAVTSGIYLYRVDSRLGSQVGKIVIIK